MKIRTCVNRIVILIKIILLYNLSILKIHMNCLSYHLDFSRTNYNNGIKVNAEYINVYLPFSAINFMSSVLTF